MGKSSGNSGTASFDNLRSREHTPQAASPPGMTTTTETQIIVRPAPDALRAAGPTKSNADASTLNDMEEKPPAPASKKHGTPASKEHAKDAAEAKKPPASKKLTESATKTKTNAKKTPASSNSTQRAKRVTASSKPAPKKPAAKQLPKKKGTAKESPKTPKLPP
ncbi:hypothetical protein PF004_g23602 [Phytophthora fragariae]|uniref:Uncharacterized protein n=1 Tax=Phytophthora fragariae TaxID=53985 RepID=A0A6G0MXD3_9STRA|nr:hypothetical protein PF004_g23602 [Phytophthora fragariae]